MNSLLLLCATLNRTQSSAEFQSYRAHIAAATSAVDSGDSRRAMSWLQSSPKAHRGWEWDYLRAQCDSSIGSFQASPRAVTKIQVSPAGDILAVASADGAVNLFDCLTHRGIGTLKGHTNSVFGLDFSSDGTKLVTTSRDNTIRLWDVKKRSEIGVLGEHPVTPYSCAFTPDAKRVVTVGWRMHTERKSPVGLIRVWDVESRKLIHDQDFTTHPISSLDFSADGKTCYIGCWEYQTLVFDMTSLKVTGELQPKPSPTYKAVDWVEVHPSGTQLITACKDKTVKIFDLATGQETAQLVHSGTVSSARFSNDGKWILTSSQDGSIRIWDPVSKNLVARLMGHGNPISGLAITPDGTRAFSGDSSGRVFAWDTQSPQTIEPMSNVDGSWSCVFSPDGTKIAAGTNSKVIQIRDAKSMKLLQELPQFDSLVVDVAWSPTGNRVAAGSNDATVRVFDIAKNTELWKFKGKGQFRATDWSADGKWIAAGDGGSGFGYIFNADSGEVAHKFQFAVGTLATCFSPDSKRAVFGSGKELTVVETRSGKKLKVVANLTTDAAEVAFSPDGRSIAVGELGGELELFNSRTGAKVWSSKTDGTQWGVHFSPDGTRIATTGYDFAVHLWEPVAGQEVLALRNLPEQGFDIRFSGDGNRIAFMSGTGITRIIDRIPFNARKEK